MLFRTLLEPSVETLPFDAQYIAALRNCDPVVEAHFVAFFKTPVWLKARRHLRSPDMAEDATQETLLRVLRYFHSGKTLDSSDRLPAFVHSTCRHVALEMLRAGGRFLPVPESAEESADLHASMELQVITEERKHMVRQVLSQLPGKDRDLLRLAMLEEVENTELCTRFGVNQDYLRVLLHRARRRFRDAVLQAEAGDRTKGLAAG